MSKHKSARANADLKPGQHRCTRCEAPVDEIKVVWLELNRDSGRYHAVGEVPPEQSQGWFAFGPDCGPMVLAKDGRIT